MSATRRLVVSIDDQALCLTENGVTLREFPVSTAVKGTGFTKDSYRTPTGGFRICEKIGAGQPAGTIFKARVPVGQWRPGEAPEKDLVLTRILRLEGLDSANANTLERCVYIHGTNREDLIGQPAGHGCVRLRNDDMIELFDMVAENDLLEILPATRRRGNLLFVAFDSALVSIDGIGEMARLRGGDVHHRVAQILSERAAGRLSRGEAFIRCMDLVRPDRDLCAEAAACCVEGIAPAAAGFIRAVRSGGWLPVIIAASPAPLVEPVARTLGIEYFEAPALDFHDAGDCRRYDLGYPMTGGLDPDGAVVDWMEAFHPRRAVMICHEPPSPATARRIDSFISPVLLYNFPSGGGGLPVILQTGDDAASDA